MLSGVSLCAHAQLSIEVSSFWSKPSQYQNIKIYHECEDWIEKSDTIWQHDACRVMTNVDRERQIFLPHSHANNGFFYLFAIKYRIFIF